MYAAIRQAKAKTGTAEELARRIKEGAIPIISDVEGFTDVGGIAQFFFEHGQLRFRIQLESAKRARLQISSRLLIMAKTK